MDVLRDGISDISVVSSMGDDASVVRAARVSFGQDDIGSELTDKDERLIYYLANHEHGTPFEHTSFTFHVACPLFVAAQWLRHRVGWSYNQVSRRYTSEDIDIFVPHEWRAQSGNNMQASEGTIEDQGEANLAYHMAVDVALRSYYRLLNLGVAREQARMVLPQSLYTRFYATCNLRSLAHFVNLRNDAHAQAEITAFSMEMENQARALFPISMEALIV